MYPATQTRNPIFTLDPSLSLPLILSSSGTSYWFAFQNIRHICLLLLVFCTARVVWTLQLPPGIPQLDWLSASTPPFLIKSGVNAVWERGSMWPAGAVDMYGAAGTIVVTKGTIWANSWRGKRPPQRRWAKRERMGTGKSRHQVGKYNTGWKPWTTPEASRGRSVQGMKQEAKAGARSERLCLLC